MIDRALLKFWTRVASATAVPDRSLHVYRWILGFYLLLFDAPFFSWIDRTPDAFFNPPVFTGAYLLGSYPPSPFFAIIDIVGIVAICTMTIGYKPMASTAIVLVTRVIGTTFAYATGKISHQIMLSLVLLCMLVAHWGARDAGDDTADHPGEAAPGRSPSRRTSQGLSLLGVLVAFGFFTAGLEKTLHWVDLNANQSGFLGWYYLRKYDLPLYLLADWVPGVPREILKLGDIAASLFEISGFVALLCGAVVWRAWLSVAVLFHLANTLLLNITFPTQAMVYLAFVSLTFLDVPRVNRFARPATYVAFAIGAWHVWTRLRGTGSGFFLWDGSRSTYVYDLYVAIAVCLVVLGLLVYDIVSRRRASVPATPEPAAELSASAT